MAKKKLNVLHVISQRPDSTGSGIYLQSLIKTSAAGGHTNFLIAALPDKSEVRLSGVEPEHCYFVRFNSDQTGKIVGMSDVMPYPTRTFKELDDHGIRNYLDTFKGPLTEMVSRYHPDVIHSHHLWLLSCFIKEQYPDVPLVTSCHGSELRQFNQCPHVQKTILDGVTRINKVLALSPEQKNEIIELYQIPEKNVSIAGSGYDDTLFYHADEARSIKTNRVLYAGKISRAKGVPWLIKALSRIERQHYHFDVVGGGTGEESDECRQAANTLGTSVTFHGMVSQQALADLMRQSKIFVLPSLHEGLPLVILEALACGCTVIATELPGTREIQRRLKTKRLILVPSPQVIDTNRTKLVEEDHFIQSLKVALEQALEQNGLESKSLQDLSYFSWPSVFSRVEEHWLRCAELGNKVVG